MICARHSKITPFFADRRGGCIYDHRACQQKNEAFFQMVRAKWVVFLALRILNVYNVYL